MILRLERRRQWSLYNILVLAVCILSITFLGHANENLPNLSKSVREWTTADIVTWLESIHLAEYSDTFVSEAIDGEILLDLTSDDIKTGLKVSKLGHIKKLEREITKLKEFVLADKSHDGLSYFEASESNTNPIINQEITPTVVEPVDRTKSIPEAPKIVKSDKAKSRKGKKKKRSIEYDDHPDIQGMPGEFQLSDVRPTPPLSDSERDANYRLLREALVVHQNGQYDVARRLYNQVLRTDPSNARALHMLALIYMAADNKPDVAIAFLRKSISLSDESDARANLGSFYLQKKMYAHAMEQWDVALEHSALAGGSNMRYNYADAAYSEALNAFNAGNRDRCLTYLVKALRLLFEADLLAFPEDYQPLPYLPKAEDSLRTMRDLTHRIRLLTADVWQHLGLLYEATDKHAFALAAYQQALDIKPDLADSMRPPTNQVITIQEETRRYASMLKNRLSDNSPTPAVYKQAEREMEMLIVDPKKSVYKKLVEFLHKTCHFESASHLATLISDDMLFHSPSYKFLFNTNEEIMHEREKFSTALTSIQKDKSLKAIWPSQGYEWCRYRFYLAYHGMSNRELNAKLARTYLYLAPYLTYTAPFIKSLQSYAKNPRKIRVAFISAFLTGHPVGKTVQGYIHHLPRDQFHVICFYLPLQPNSEQDPLKLKFEEWADEFVTLPLERVSASRQMIEDRTPDVLIYGDIGMEPSTYFLAFSRLAPIQALTFGHPDTSGIPAIDYFISHKDMDDEDHGAEFYSETLVRLDGVGYWERTILPTVSGTRTFLGVDDSQLNLPLPSRTPSLGSLPGGSWDKVHEWTMYLVTKSIQFYSPDFIEVLGTILARHPRSFLALVVDSGKQSRGYESHNQCAESILDNIEAQISRHYHQSGHQLDQEVIDGRLPRSKYTGRVRFIDKGDHTYFLSLMNVTDVLLQPMPLDGTTTTLEAISSALPTVIHKSDSVGGRMAYAMYRKMQFMDTVANTKQEYIDIAVRLGTDHEFNSHVRSELRTRPDQYQLFEDPSAITHMAHWLQTTVRETIQ